MVKPLCRWARALGIFLDVLEQWHYVAHRQRYKQEACFVMKLVTCVVSLLITRTSIKRFPWQGISTVRCIMDVQASSERTKDGEIVAVQKSPTRFGIPGFDQVDSMSTRI